MLMEKTYIGLALFFLGLCLGSFVNAAVWRIKNKKNLTTERSECTKCHYKLEWYDLVPVLSWLWLKGRCRKCKKPISSQYPLVELTVAAFFITSFAFWSHGLETTAQLVYFAIWLLVGVGLAILAVYDLRWMLLPDKVMLILLPLAVSASVAKGFESTDVLTYLANVLGSLAILSGFYLLVYMYSKGKWIGFGDVKLGIILGLMLSDWKNAILALFLANLIGCIIIIPGLLMKKLKRTSHIPFGPFLIIGFVLAGLFGGLILDWYIGVTFSGMQLPAYRY